MIQIKNSAQTLIKSNCNLKNRTRERIRKLLMNSRGIYAPLHMGLYPPDLVQKGFYSDINISTLSTQKQT